MSDPDSRPNALLCSFGGEFHRKYRNIRNFANGGSFDHRKSSSLHLELTRLRPNNPYPCHRMTEGADQSARNQQQIVSRSPKLGGASMTLPAA